MLVGADEYDLMSKITVVVFEILERAWSTLDCSLIDMKIEFGVDTKTGVCLMQVILPVFLHYLVTCH